MSRHSLRTAGLVAAWSLISATAMLITLVPVGVAAGVAQWAILRRRLNLGWRSAIAFGLSFPAGQFPAYVIYLAVYASGFGGFDGPPGWFVSVTLASGGLLAGVCQFLGLPKSRRNFVIWVPATSIAWMAAALGDLNLRGAVTLSALLSGLVTGLAMLALSKEGRAGEAGKAGGERADPASPAHRAPPARSRT
jgi:hypothetical protein